MWVLQDSNVRMDPGYTDASWWEYLAAVRESLIRTRSRTRGDADADRVGLQMRLYFFYFIDITDTLFSNGTTLQNSRVSGVKYIRYGLTKKYHRTCIVKPSCDQSILWGKLERLDTALNGKDIFKYGNQLFDNPLLLHFWLLATWGSCIVFNYIPGLLFPKKIMQSQSGSITFRRVGFSICVHRWRSATLIRQ